MNGLKQVLAGTIAQHVLLQIIATFPTAYILGLVVTAKQKGGVVLNAIPPMFWPILAGLVLIVTVYHGFLYPMYKKRKEKSEAYRQEVESAYEWVTQAYKPSILNPRCPGNPHTIKEYAQRAVDTLRPKLVKKCKGAAIPQAIDVSDEHSLEQWYNYLREERARAVKP